jgi:hypothetical protein
VPGDYDGDGKTDVAIFRPSSGVWYVRTSSSGFSSYFTVNLGASTDIPVTGDFDGDGKTDVAVWTPSTGVWSVLSSSSNFTTLTQRQWGLPTDVPALRRQ